MISAWNLRLSETCDKRIFFGSLTTIMHAVLDFLWNRGMAIAVQWNTDSNGEHCGNVH
jgi:hypothetical protein